MARLWTDTSLQEEDADEIRALKPEFIQAVGNKARHFLTRYDDRLHGSLLHVLNLQVNGPLTDVDVAGKRTTVAVVPHPSGLSRFWNNPFPERWEALEAIQRSLLKALS